MTRSFYFTTETTLENFLLTLMRSILILNVLWILENKILGFSWIYCIRVCRSNNNFGTSVYRKQFFTGLRTSFFQLLPFNFKINSIKALIRRAYRIFSEIDGPLDFNETLVNGSLLNLVSMNNIRFFCGNHYSKSYQHLKLFISYIIVKKIKLSFFISTACFKNYLSKERNRYT